MTPIQTQPNHHAVDRVSLDDLYTVNDLAKQFPEIVNAAALRWQLRTRSKSGLASACIRIGKKLFISKTRYERWLATQIEVVAHD